MKGSIRQLAFPGFELGDYIREAVDFLRRHEPPDGYFMGFSGGKDSIVTEKLCRMAKVKYQAFYSCTRIDPPEIYRFIEQYYPDVTWLYPKITMLSGIIKYCPPYRNRRWCCDHLKKAPAHNHPLKHRIMGIRAEESLRRASRPRIDTFSGQTTYKVIFQWPEWAIWEFIDAYKLPYPSLYDEGFYRVGCVVCPFIMGLRPGAVHIRKISIARWPGIWKAYEHAVKRWWTASTKNSPRHKSYPGETVEDYWQAYLNGFESNKKSSGHETGQSQILRLHQCQN